MTVVIFKMSVDVLQEVQEDIEDVMMQETESYDHITHSNEVSMSSNIVTEGHTSKLGIDINIHIPQAVEARHAFQTLSGNPQVTPVSQQKNLVSVGTQSPTKSGNITPRRGLRASHTDLNVTPRPLSKESPKHLSQKTSSVAKVLPAKRGRGRGGKGQSVRKGKQKGTITVQDYMDSLSPQPDPGHSSVALEMPVTASDGSTMTGICVRSTRHSNDPYQFHGSQSQGVSLPVASTVRAEV